MIRARQNWEESPYYKERLISLYTFLKRAAGPELGKQVYQEAVSQDIPFGEKHITNPRYTGRVLIYPISWLEKYFGQKYIKTERDLIYESREDDFDF